MDDEKSKTDKNDWYFIVVHNFQKFWNFLMEIKKIASVGSLLLMNNEKAKMLEWRNLV